MAKGEQLQLFETPKSNREQRLERFIRKWLPRMTTHMADDAKFVLDGLPIPDYEEQERIRREAAQREWEASDECREKEEEFTRDYCDPDMEDEEEDDGIHRRS